MGSDPKLKNNPHFKMNNRRSVQRGTSQDTTINRHTLLRYILVPLLVSIITILLCITLRPDTLSYANYVTVYKIYEILVSNIGITAAIAISAVMFVVLRDRNSILPWNIGWVFIGLVFVLSALRFEGMDDFGTIVIDGCIFKGYSTMNRAEGYGELFDPLSERLVFKGYFSANAYNGQGTEYQLFYTDHEENLPVYIGEYKNHKKHGYGKEYAVSESQYYLRYEGDYEDGYRCGQGKWYYLENGESRLRYDGEFKDGIYNGLGTEYEYEDGKQWIKYEGPFQDNLFNGEDGTEYCLVDGKSRVKYIGSFLNDLYNGYGTEYYYEHEEQRIKYKGWFSDGVYNGNGELHSSAEGADYIEYDGAFVNGMFNGNGEKYIYENGHPRLLYDGEFKDNLYDGHGKYYGGEGEYYEGSFKDGSFVKGTYYVSDVYEGMSYRIIGSFVDWKAEGICEQYWDDILRFKGEFHDNQRNGTGTDYAEDGRVEFEGHYVNGEKHGSGIEYDLSGNQTEVVYEYGRRRK